MKSKIQKTQIEKYRNFMVDLKSYIDSGTGFSTTEITKAHSVSGAVWNALKMAKFISGNKQEGNLKFNLDSVEPIHARIAIEKLREYAENSKNGIKNMESFNDTNLKYLDFLKSFYFLTKEGVDFKQADLIRKHGVSKNIIHACFKTKLVVTKNNKISFINEPTLKDADRIREYVVNQQRESMKVSREKGNVKSEKPKEKQKETKPTKQKTVYYLFGIKIMESITIDII